MSHKHRKFVEAVFEMEFDMMGTVIKKLGFSTYLVRAEDGNVYQFKC